MTHGEYHYYYRDGQEIFLGDMVELNHQLGYIERIWGPNTVNAVAFGIPRGGFMVYESNGNFLVMEFDYFDVLDPGHIDCGLNFVRRADYWFHFRFFLRYSIRFIGSFARLKLWKKSWWEYTTFDFIRMSLSLHELIQSFIFGPGKNVRQMIDP